MNNYVVVQSKLIQLRHVLVKVGDICNTSLSEGIQLVKTTT